MSSSSSSSSSSFSCHYFTLDEIKEATNNFDEGKVIGHGGEGKVYLANIYLYRKKKKTPVAVKHLKPNSIEFDKEIQTVSKIHHPNLVSLLGYCQESGQKILVYEYMQNGSLSDYVKKKKTGTPNSLPWKQRLNICIDAARGLQHLHTSREELPKGIIHRDIKPANILLDKYWVAKVSDFGLFKLSQAGQTHSGVITDLKGTSGYYAPECLIHNQISRKVDVYAFGVVMFEVLCRKSPWDRGEESYFMEEEDDLGLWARENVDTEIKEEISEDSLVVFTDIIRRCLQRDPTKRPTMDDILLVLLDLTGCRICAGCDEEIGHGLFLLGMNGYWHPECFSLPIGNDDRGFSWDETGSNPNIRNGHESNGKVQPMSPGLSMISQLAEEFEQRSEVFKDDAKFLVEEVKANLDPDLELTRLKALFEGWKKDYEHRLRETKVILNKLGNEEGTGNGRGDRLKMKWWGMLNS